MAAPRLPGDPPRGLFWHRGAHVPRRLGWVVNLNRIECPDGHAMRFTRNIREDGYLECGHPSHAGQARPVIWVYVPPALGGTRRLWAADVTQAERDWINDQGYTSAAIKELLGGIFPRARRRA